MNILMGRDNPDGHKLEELLHKVAGEVEAKCIFICDDPRLEAKTVLRNNQQIIGLLRQAEALQRHSYDVLDNMSKNEGPLGRYRIGKQAGE
jgi:hypothetical protein